jgi:hypothetical protein
MALYTKSAFDKKISAVDKAADNINKDNQANTKEKVTLENPCEYALLHPDINKDGIYFVGTTEYNIHKGIIKTLSINVKNQLIKAGFMFLYQKDIE